MSMVAVPPSRSRPSRSRRDAADLAATPTPNPYRGQLSDPFCDQPVPDGVTLFVPRGARQVDAPRNAPAQTRPNVPSRAPSAAVTAGVIGLVIGTLIGIFGLVLLAVISLEQDLSGQDRSFYQGSDASYVLMAMLNFALCACLVAGAIGLMSGRVGGRITLTAGIGTALLFSAFWWDEGRAPVFIPVVVGFSAALALVLSYRRDVTDWLGVLPVPQPE
jgi:hypothetical protein